MEIEAAALAALWSRAGDDIRAALELLQGCEGRAIISGLGKSGHIASKIAATWSSFGIPSYFLNSSEALHGDYGMCQPEDIGVVISYSGKTAEVVAVAQWMKNFGMKVIALSKSADSPIGQIADVHVPITVDTEADPLNLGPTASTITTLAIGDALGSGLQAMTGFTAEDFRLRHPGGSLGQQLGSK